MLLNKHNQAQNTSYINVKNMPDLMVAKGNDRIPAPSIAVDNPKILPFFKP